MTSKRIIAVLFAVSVLPGCMHPSLIVGQASAPIGKEEVVVYYFDRPWCNFETVALIQIRGGYFSLKSMLAKMRQEAADVGASGLYVLHTQQLDMKEFLGTAKAIRCLSV